MWRVCPAKYSSHNCRCGISPITENESKSRIPPIKIECKLHRPLVILFGELDLVFDRNAEQYDTHKSNSGPYERSTISRETGSTYLDTIDYRLRYLSPRLIHFASRNCVNPGGRYVGEAAAEARCAGIHHLSTAGTSAVERVIGSLMPCLRWKRDRGLPWRPGRHVGGLSRRGSANQISYRYDMRAQSPFLFLSHLNTRW